MPARKRRERLPIEERRKNREQERQKQEAIRERKARLSSTTWYRDTVNPKAYSFEETTSYEYKDNVTGICLNLLPPVAYTFGKYFVLKDSHKRPRFVNRYFETNKGIVINSIQRERTQYDSRGENIWWWNKDRERLAEQEFAKELEMPPNEFLLCEFIRRFRQRILAGEKVFLLVPETKSLTKSSDFIWASSYLRIIEKYFSRNNTFTNDLPVLDLNKKRVRLLLGLPLD